MNTTYNRNHNIISSAISFFLILLSFLFLLGFWTPVSASATNGARSYYERLPIQYEEWYDKVLACEVYKNYKYKDFLFPHGYTSTETRTKIDLTPLEYEFYDYAWLVTITYDFY